MQDFLTYADTVGALNWRDAVEALRQGHLRPKAEIGDLLLGPTSGVLLNRAAYIDGVGYAVKAETVITGNAVRGLPTVQGAVLLYTPDTGSLRAVIESRLVTEYKTAGDSVLGARLLARPDSRHLVIVGAGVMAACLARAYAALFPDLERFSIWARRPEQAEALATRLALPGITLCVEPDLTAALADADIITAATMAREPILFGDWIRPGTHVDLIGAYLPDMREADDRADGQGFGLRRQP
jgi:ornithine cyclodeaminase